MSVSAEVIDTLYLSQQGLDTQDEIGQAFGDWLLDSREYNDKGEQFWALTWTNERLT